MFTEFVFIDIFHGLILPITMVLPSATPCTGPATKFYMRLPTALEPRRPCHSYLQAKIAWSNVDENKPTTNNKNTLYNRRSLDSFDLSVIEIGNEEGEGFIPGDALSLF